MKIKADKVAANLAVFQESKKKRFMLKQEESKLKDHDMKKVHERAKRLLWRKKEEIITKEK